MYLTLQVLCVVLHLTPLGYLVLWRKHAYIQRLHANLMIIRGQFMAVFCTFLIHEFPVWRDGLDSSNIGCWPLWITGHVAFSAGLLAEIFSLLHMWLVYTIDYLQSSTASVLACEYQGFKATTLTKTISGHRDRLSSSHSNPVSVFPAISRSFKLDSVSTVLARLSLWIFHTPGLKVVQQLDGDNHWVLKPTRPDGHLPVVTVALAFRTRAKLLGLFAWMLALAASIASRRVILPTHSLFPSSQEACTGNDMTGLTYLAAVTTIISSMIVAATHTHRARCTEEMSFLRWTCGWRVVSFAFLAPCYFATWLHVAAFRGILATFGPWVFPAVWETCSGALRSWSPVLIVWLQRRRDQRHWANLPETRLRKVLEDPAESAAFGAFCARQHCNEAYQFYVDYQQLIVASAAAPAGADMASSFCARKASLLSPLMGSLLLLGGNRHRNSVSNSGDGSRSIASEASSSKSLVVSIDAGRPRGQGRIASSQEMDESTPAQSPDQRMHRRSPNPPQHQQPDIVISITTIESDSTPLTPLSPRRGASVAAIAPFLDGDDDENDHMGARMSPSTSSNPQDPFGECPLPPSAVFPLPLPHDPLPARLGYFLSQYVEQGSPKEVNISAASRQRFVQALHNARALDAARSLAEIREHVFQVMLDGVFVRYCEEKVRQSVRKQGGKSWLPSWK